MEKTVYRTGGVGGEDAPGEDERGDGKADLRLGTFEEILRGRGGGGGGGGGGEEGKSSVEGSVEGSVASSVVAGESTSSASRSTAPPS